jgi:hypothetical protein
MKRSYRLLVFLGLVALSCQAQQPGDLYSKQPLGYELYSWRAGHSWNFSLLLNSSSEKSVDQVFSKQFVLRGMGQLKASISRLPKGSQIFWINRIPSGDGPRAAGSEKLSYPPITMQEDIVRYAKNHHVEIQSLGKSKIFLVVDAWEGCCAGRAQTRSRSRLQIACYTPKIGMLNQEAGSVRDLRCKLPRPIHTLPRVVYEGGSAGHLLAGLSPPLSG